MILEQQIWKAKVGRKDDLVALGKALAARTGIACRISTPLTHPSTVVVFEFPFEDLAQQARFWARWNAEPEVQRLLQRLRDLVEKEHRNELFKVL
jgi:hypothetical protein